MNQLQYHHSVETSQKLWQREKEMAQLNKQLDAEKKNSTQLSENVEEQKKKILELESKLQETTLSTAKSQSRKQEEKQPATVSDKTNKPALNSKVNITGKEYVGMFTTTFYCGENYPHICGTGNGMTASGAKAAAGITVAADTSVLPMGTKIYIEGIGERVVQDRGGGIKGNKLDVFVITHTEALSNGVQKRKVWIVG